MEKQVVHYTYWLGLAATLVALIWRGLIMAGLPARVLDMNYMTFYKGALLFFVAAVAGTSYAWLKSQKP